MAGLNRRRGAIHLLSGQWARYALQLAGLAILSRLVSPESFGLFTMVFAIVGVATVLGDFGLSLAAIRAPRLSQAEKSNLLWLNAAFGMALGIIVASLAPAISALYGQPLLVAVTLALAVNFPINGLAVQFRVELNRRGRFGRLALADVVAQALSLCVSVVLAVAGYGLEALVAQSVAYASAGLLLNGLMAGWRPSLWTRKVKLGRFMIFGANTTLLQFVNYAATNIGAVIIGQTYGAATLGQYNRASQLSSAPVQQFASPLTRLVLPRIASAVSDPARLRRVVLRHLLLIGWTLVAILSFLFVAAPSLVSAILGPGWALAADFVRVLAVGCAFQALGYVFYWAALACERTDLLVLSELPGRLLVIVGATVAAAAGVGALGLAAIASLGLTIVWLLGLLLTATKLDLDATRLGAISIRILCCCSVGPLASLILGEILTSYNVAAQLFASVLIWVIPVAGSYLLPPVRKEWAIILSMVGRDRK